MSKARNAFDRVRPFFSGFSLNWVAYVLIAAPVLLIPGIRLVWACCAVRPCPPLKLCHVSQVRRTRAVSLFPVRPSHHLTVRAVTITTGSRSSDCGTPGIVS